VTLPLKLVLAPTLVVAVTGRATAGTGAGVLAPFPTGTSVVAAFA
jgi:hypothetical protein